MRPIETVSALAAFDGHGAGTDAERRAAKWLAQQLRDAGREVVTETFWCRPNWALAHAWHVALALAGSLVSVNNQRVGGVMLLVALLSTVSDVLWTVSLGRRLTPERASQNVVALPPERARSRRVSLILTANYDAGRAGEVRRRGLRAPVAGLRILVSGFTPGWLGWVAIAQAWLIVVAVVRLEPTTGRAVAVAQLFPTVGLVIALAALLDLAAAGYGPAAADNGSGVAAVLALSRALDAVPPARSAVHVVLAGAGDGNGLGLRAYLHSRRASLQDHNAVVLGVSPCTAPSLRWWDSDGSFIPVRHFRELRRICRRIVEEDPGIGMRPYRGRGASPALPARLAGIPSLSIGSVDELGLFPRSQTQWDTAERVDPVAIDRAVELGLLLVDGIDGFLAQVPERPRVASPAPRSWFARPRAAEPQTRRRRRLMRGARSRQTR